MLMPFVVGDVLGAGIYSSCACSGVSRHNERDPRSA
jgi:hypothetical protein